MTQHNLYNCYSTPQGHRIVKFDSLLPVEAVYNLSQARDSKGKPYLSCDCPAGPRPSCKHRKMLSAFALAGAVNSDRFLCYETQTWHKPVAIGNEPPMKEKLDLFNEALSALLMETTTAVEPQPCKPRETAKQIVAEQIKPIRRI